MPCRNSARASPRRATTRGGKSPRCTTRSSRTRRRPPRRTARSHPPRNTTKTHRRRRSNPAPPRSVLNAMAHLLGIDVGTGGTRALVIDEHGHIVASATGEHAPVASPETGWAEQDPRDWWRATGEAVRKVLRASGTSPDSITAVGFSGQMHGSSLLDAQGEVVRPALLWCDQRT